MTDFTWPEDLPPFEQSFWLQPHTGGQESPFNRVAKIYELGAPRWMCTMSFRGGYWGTRGEAAFGPRLDSLVAAVRRANRIAIWDFRRADMRSPLWPRSASNLSAAAGATAMTITGLAPGTPVYAGDYLGGDGRPHIIRSADFGAVAAVANSSGQAVVDFDPPLKATVGAGAAIFGNPTGIFRLADDNAGQNGVVVAEAQVMTLDFVEDL